MKERHDPTASERQKRYTESMKEKGFKRVCVWVKPENVKAVREFAAKLEEKG